MTYDFGSSLGIMNVFWQYVIYPSFHIVQNARFAGVALITILLGFFFIRLSYRFIILPLVGSGDQLTDKANTIKAERQHRIRERRKQALAQERHNQKQYARYRRKG